MISLTSGLFVDNYNFVLVLFHFRPARVILSVPHDGFIVNDLSGLFRERKHGWKGRDRYVWPIANDLVQKSLQLGVRVDAIRFLMSRAYVDGNRELLDDENLDPDTLGQTALDDWRLEDVYRNYHSELREFIERSKAAFGSNQILFIDLHGFGRQPKFAPASGYDLILGTANRSTIHHGEIDRMFAKFMEERGYCVFLPGEKPVVPEGDPYSAGHTTRWYAKQYGINAMQIEVSSAFRHKDAKDKGEKLAADIAEFLSLHYR